MQTALKKEAHLRAFFRDHPGCLVALSGGIDSSYLALVACQELGERMLAVTGDSPSVPRAMLELARAFTTAHRIPHAVVPTSELESSDYRRNDEMRCYHCKRDLFERLRALAAERGFGHLVEGTQGSDADDDRPGARAAKELEVHSPLQALGFSKEEIRANARRLGIAHYDLPESACLASRIARGNPVTEGALRQVEEGEVLVRAMGFSQFRLRHHGDWCRLELLPKEMPRLFADGRREALLERLAGLGFSLVTLDLHGYKRGGGNFRMNKDSRTD
jgi:uncharacterized protein